MTGKGRSGAEQTPPSALSPKRRVEQSYWFCSRIDGTHEDGCASANEAPWPLSGTEPTVPCAPDCALPDWPHHGPCAAVPT